MRDLRATAARRQVREEIPFYTGRLVDVDVPSTSCGNGRPGTSPLPGVSRLHVTQAGYYIRWAMGSMNIPTFTSARTATTVPKGSSVQRRFRGLW